MAKATGVRVEFTPTHNDQAIAALLYKALASMRSPERFGDRKVFVGPLWHRLRSLDSTGSVVGDARLADFKTWLLRARRLTHDGTGSGRPLVVLARADLVSAMDPAVVAESEIKEDLAQYHFVLDPAVAHEEYASDAGRRRRSGYYENPTGDMSWVNKAITNAWRTIEKNVAPQLYPKLDNIRATDNVHVTATLREYGCGKYGCVYPTSDPGVVMKLTTDDTEAQFAGQYAESLIRPICVHYYTVISTSQYHGSKRVHLLWRESADKVGKIEEVLGFEGADLIDEQHDASQIALKLLITDGYASPKTRAAIAAWLEACERMARQTLVPQLRELGNGMVDIFAEQRIFFGDIHSGNVGLVARDDGGHWVITDPGNIVILTDY